MGNNVTLIAYGLKNGHPDGLNIKIGVTELRNPHRIKGLRELTGRSPAVRIDVMSATNYIECSKKWLERIIEKSKEFPHSLKVGIHCHAGKHRSVVVADNLAEALKLLGYTVQVECRDINK